MNSIATIFISFATIIFGIAEACAGFDAGSALTASGGVLLVVVSGMLLGHVDWSD